MTTDEPSTQRENDTTRDFRWPIKTIYTSLTKFPQEKNLKHKIKQTLSE